MIYLLMKKNIAALFVLANFIACKTASVQKQPAGNILEILLKNNPAYFEKILATKDSFQLQIIYTKIDRDKNNKPFFTDYNYNTNRSLYFYPASTVKMPVALLALEKLNELNVNGLDKFSIMDAGARASTDETQLTPASIAEYIKQIFLVSDNNAFNSLYEFVGQQYIQEKLAAKGYKDVEIRHRLQLSLTEEQNRKTNGVRFYNKESDIIYRQPEAYSKTTFKARTNLLGNGYFKNDSLVKEPYDFSKKNKVHLTDLHSTMRSVIFPESIAENKRFNLTESDYKFLYRYMSAYPSESKQPHYDTTIYYKNYSKFLLLGSEKSEPPSYIRIFNKEGDAYGFLTDVAYIVDFKNKVEFMLSATILCNSDGIFNDDKYDYDDIGFPFFKNLGSVIYDYELQRKKKHLPDLSSFEIDYSKE
ncbi:hypothetical protein BH10BAC3_BH10BAC3_26150 [soil metagenome]